MRQRPQRPRARPRASRLRRRASAARKPAEHDAPASPPEQAGRVAPVDCDVTSMSWPSVLVTRLVAPACARPRARCALAEALQALQMEAPERGLTCTAGGRASAASWLQVVELGVSAPSGRLECKRRPLDSLKMRSMRMESLEQASPLKVCTPDRASNLRKARGEYVVKRASSERFLAVLGVSDHPLSICKTRAKAYLGLAPPSLCTLP